MHKSYKFMIAVAVLATTSSATIAQDAPGFKQTLLGTHDLDVSFGDHQMRVLRFTVEPGGSLSLHRHTGPGYVCVLNSQLTNTVGTEITVVSAGSCVFDDGEENHSLKNTNTKTSVTGLTFEVVPSTDDTDNITSRTAQTVPVIPGMESVIPPK